MARLDGTAAAEVLVMLVEAALSAGEFDEAARLCDEARSHDYAHPGVRQVTRRLAQAREEIRRPLEVTIGQLLAESRLEEARLLAEPLLERFPESAMARRAVRAALEHQRTSEVERLIEQAQEALAQADLGTLRSALHAARALSATAPLDAALDLRLTAIESELAARELEARVSDAVGRLAEPNPRAGLLGYAALSPEIRRRVRDVAGLPILEDLERLLDRRSDPEDAVTALLAFGEAATIADSDPEAALLQLAAHERVLAGLGAATRLAAQLRQRIGDERRRQLSDLLAVARGRLGAGDAAASLELLETVALRKLEPGERESVEVLRAATKASLEAREIEASYEHLMEAGEPLAAREAAERLLARAGEAERGRRRDQVAAAREAARRAFGVWVSQVGDDPAKGHDAPHTIELGAPLKITANGGEPVPWIDATARSLVLVECYDHWIFVQLVDLAAGHVRARAVIRTPERLVDPTTAVSPAGTLTIATCQGVLELSLETWEPLSWVPRRALGFEGLNESIMIAPGGRFVWTHSLRNSVITRASAAVGQTRVVDLDRKRVVREIPDGPRFWPLVGASEPTMGYSRRGTTLSLHHPGGALMDGGRIELPASVCHALVHPSGRGLLVFLEEDSKARERLGFVEIDATGRSPSWLEDMSPRQPRAFATSLLQQTSFVVAREGDGSLFLHALRAERPSLRVERVYRASIPGGTRLARDPSSRHVFALVPDHERLHVVPLGPEPPTFPSCAPAEFLQLPGFKKACGFIITVGSDIWVSARELRNIPEKSATAWMQRRLAEAGADIAELLKIHHALEHGQQQVLRENFLCWMEENLPSDPHTVALRAAEHARAMRWADVRSMLECVDLNTILPEHRQHAYHIYGLALLHGGETERAIAVIEEGHRTTTNGCHLDELLAAIRPLRDENDPCSPLGRLRAAIDEADACLLRDDLPGGRAALGRRIVWEGGEVQSLARLAEVELRAEPGPAVGIFRKALALARFLDVHRTTGLRKDLPLPGTSWPAPRLADIEARAQAWLARLGAPEAALADINPPAAESSTPVAISTEWELALGDLDAALDAMSADESPRAPARLAFRVRHAGRKFDGIDVLLQRQLRSGRFSAGQLADAGDILAAADVFVEETDAAAIVVLTEGIPQASRSRPSPSRARLLRLLAALIGHPRVFLTDRPAESVRVQHGCLGLELVGATGGLVPRFILGGAHWSADELMAQVESSVVIDVDAEARVIMLAPLGAAVLALVEAFQRHQPVFPAESHRELRRRLGALQHAVELHLPEELAGRPHAADSRAVVRLTPEGDAGLFVEIGVRPVPGAAFGRPGEGSRLALGAVDGLHVAARRDLARERTSAERVAALPAFDGATREGRWRYRMNGEDQSLAVVEALTEIGAEVVVEWPKDARAWRWVGRATSTELRVRVAQRHDLLSIEGGVEIDDHRVALAALLEAIAQGRRYVAVGPQVFIGLAAELREHLAAAAELIHAGRGGLEAGLSAAPSSPSWRPNNSPPMLPGARSVSGPPPREHSSRPSLPSCTPISDPTRSRASAGSRDCRRGLPARASRTTWGSARRCKPWPCSCTARRSGRRW